MLEPAKVSELIPHASDDFGVTHRVVPRHSTFNSRVATRPEHHVVNLHSTRPCRIAEGSQKPRPNDTIEEHWKGDAKRSGLTSHRVGDD